jgi:hypothetical protein
MSVDRVERGWPSAPVPEMRGGKRWSWKRLASRGGSWGLKLVVLVALGAAGVWA